MSTDASFNNAFRAETTALYAVGLAFILTRIASRIRKLGLSRLSYDDWFMAQNLLWYTLLYVSSTKVIFGGGSNFMSEEDIANLTPETTATRIAGSKWVLVNEEQGLKQLKIVNYVTIFVVLGFVGVQIALFTTCRPFSGYWSVPPINTQCWSYFNYQVIEGCFNITADIALLFVGLPLLFKARVPLKQKLILMTIFGMGIFVITAAVLCKVYGLYTPLISYSYLAWFFREASVSVYVTNIPVIYSLLREAFPKLARWGYKSTQGSATRSNTNGRNRTGTKDIGMKPVFNRLGSTTDENEDSLKTQSQEHIIQYKNPDPLQIHKDVTFSVQRGSSDDEDLEAGRRQHHDPSHIHATTYITAR
ncbi:MAG: hypothetical protein Q9208_006748 [Pyrenodesmia sp. 3 TL-2023]